MEIPPLGREFAPYLDVFRVHQADQVLHDDVHAVLVESPRGSRKAEQVQLEGLALHHAGGRAHRRSMVAAKSGWPVIGQRLVNSGQLYELTK